MTLLTSAAPGSVLRNSFPRPSRVAGGVLLAAATATLVGFLIQAHRRALDAARRAPSFSVSTAIARRGDFPVYLTAMGMVGAWNTVTVRSRVDGQLLALHFTDGQYVREGDLLAEIDPRPYRAALEQAQGTLAHDRALLEEARLDLKRYQQAGDSVTAQQIDTAKSAVDENEGAVRSDQAAVDNDRLQLDFSRIAAPTSGRLGLRAVDAGNMVQVADANGLVVITQDEPIAVFFSVPEINLAAIRSALADKSAQKVEALDESTQRVIAIGTLFALDNQIDASTGTVRLKAMFPNRDHALFPDQFVTVRFLLNTDHAATLVPRSAIETNENASLAFVVRADHTVEQRPITLGDSDGETAVVTQGITPGELLVSDNLEQMTNGARVSEVEEPSSSATPDAGPSGRPHRAAEPTSVSTPE